MSAPPYMKLYVADYLGDTHHLGALEHGAYVLLLMGMWRAGGSLPAADANLSRLARCTPDEWEAIKGVVLPFFKRARGKLTHKRITAEMAKYETVSRHRSEAGKAGAAKKAQRDNELAQANAGVLPTKPEPEPEPKQEETTSLVRRAPNAVEMNEDFTRAWKTFPPLGRQRSKSQAKTLPIWREAAKAAGGGDRLANAVSRYVREDQTHKGDCGPPAFDRWLRDGRWEHWLPDASAPTSNLDPALLALHESLLNRTSANA